MSVIASVARSAPARRTAGSPAEVLERRLLRLPNVFFSIGSGLVLLVMGAYGRISGGLSSDNPYRTDAPVEAVALPNQPTPATPAEWAADRDMAVAESAVAQGTASARQAAGVEEIGELRTHEDRRRAWMRWAN